MIGTFPQHIFIKHIYVIEILNSFFYIQGIYTVLCFEESDTLRTNIYYTLLDFVHKRYWTWGRPVKD